MIKNTPYNNISTAQKDNLCDGIDIQQLIEQHNKKKDAKTDTYSLKRHPTNHSLINEDDYSDVEYANTTDSHHPYNDNYNNNFQLVNNNRHREKKRYKNDKDERTHIRIINNSNINYNNNNKNVRTTTVNENILNNQNPISKHALEYASEYHHQPLKIECEPKIKDQREGARFIQSFLNYIKNDFLKQNKTFNKPLLFELWWIDKDGNIQVITKAAEIQVYLAAPNNYPNELNNIKITPHPPKHLPPQHTAILKWVKNSVTFEDIKEEINAKYQSVYLIEEIMGTMNERNRHIRIELSDKKEYNSMLNCGKISIFGYLYDIDEYLPSPKLLICSKCNQPGHIRKSCQSSNFDICKRCGGDRRKNEEEHKECTIKCHHCQGEHTATDFKCPFIQEYRRRLIIELKKRPDMLPPDIQLFIPTDYREPGERIKIICNKSSQNHLQRNNEQIIYERNNINVWPQLPSRATNLDNSIQILDNELQTLKKNFEEEQHKIEQKHQLHLKIIKQNWSLMKQQIEIHTELIYAMNNTIKQTLFPTYQKTINMIINVVNKLKIQTNSNEYDDALNEITTHISFINDSQSSYIKHQEALDSILKRQKEILGSASETLSEINE